MLMLCVGTPRVYSLFERVHQLLPCFKFLGQGRFKQVTFTFVAELKKYFKQKRSANPQSLNMLLQIKDRTS